MNHRKKTQQVETKIFRGVGYLLLVGAAFCTMIPMLWLLTSSFKTANEIFAVPIQWFPNLPPRVASSPYIVEDAYPKIEKPMAVDEAVMENPAAPTHTDNLGGSAVTHRSKWEVFQLCLVRRITNRNNRGFMATTGRRVARRGLERHNGFGYCGGARHYYS